MRCSNYILVINKLIAYLGAAYIKDLTACLGFLGLWLIWLWMILAWLFCLLSLQEQGPLHRLIGEFNMTSGHLHINDSILDWGPHKWTYQENTSFPHHRCSAPCPKGHFKVVGDQSCCWKCFQCRNNEILVDNATSCAVCPEKQWPVDDDQVECAAIPHTFLTWGDLYGTILAGLSGLGLLLTIILSVTLIRKRNLRVVKGSGLHMLLVILTGIYLAFSTVFAHIDKPVDGICVFGRVGFHFSFTLIFGPMLVKTNRIFQVFLASSKLSRKVFMGSEFSQKVALSVIISIQVNINTFGGYTQSQYPFIWSYNTENLYWFKEILHELYQTSISSISVKSRGTTWVISRSHKYACGLVVFGLACVQCQHLGCLIFINLYS